MLEAGCNFAENYPQGTTFSERLKLFEERMRLSNLVGENIDPAKGKEEIASIRAARERQLTELMQAQLYATNSAEVSMLPNQLTAVSVGLPEDTHRFVIQ